MLPSILLAVVALFFMIKWWLETKKTKSLNKEVLAQKNELGLNKDFSDAIYGKEPKNRYVTQNRLRKMLRYEVSLIEERLDRTHFPDRRFFSYANTVTTINFDKTNQGHGWVGIRFQSDVEAEYNEIVIHVKFKENDANILNNTTI
mgnify:CR=1 FL=1